MRTIVNTLIAILVMTSVSCQNTSEKDSKNNSKAPDAVQATFEKKYPGENDPDWEVDAHGNYEAHFKKKGEKYRADFSPEGMWIETENSIKVKELPKVIRDKINTQYAAYTISEVERVDHHKKGLFYDVEFKQKGKNLDIEFDADGNKIN